MLNLAKADLYRMVRTKGSYLCIGSIIVMYLLSMITNQPLVISLGYSTDVISDTTLKTDMVMLACNFNYYFLMLFPISVLIISDFSGKTVKNTLCSVTSKGKYFVFKSLFAECVSLTLFLLGNSVYYLFHRIFYGAKGSTQASVFFRILILQVPIFIAMISIFVLFAFTIRTSAVFNAVMITVPVVLSGVIGLLLFIRSTKRFAQDYLVRYDITALFDKMVQYRTDTNFVIQTVTGSIAVTVIVFAIGLRCFRKSEPLRQ